MIKKTRNRPFPQHPCRKCSMAQTLGSEQEPWTWKDDLMVHTEACPLQQTEENTHCYDFCKCSGGRIHTGYYTDNQPCYS